MQRRGGREVDMVKECVRYFLERPGFQRALVEMKKKWVSYGRVTNSKIVIKNVNKEEKEALQAFLSCHFWDDTIEFTFADFENALKKTKFWQVTVKELLEAYFAEKIITKNQSRQRKAEGIEQFRNEINRWIELTFPLSDFFWMTKLQNKGYSGFAYISNLWSRDAYEAEMIIKCVCKAMELLQSNDTEGLQLAVLAAKVSGNPHFFDRGQRATQVLQYAICSKYNAQLPKSAEEILSLYEKAGIIVDKLSSTVIAYGIHMIKNGKEYAPIEALKKIGEPMTLSLSNLEQAERIYIDSDIVLIVENEMVYSHLLPLCVEKGLPFLCTSGQLSKAAQKVLRLLCAEGIKICYSGDTDPEGLQIADELWKKYPEQIVMWRMSTEDYRISISEETIGEPRIQKLKKIDNPELQDVARAIIEQGKSGYQENIIHLFETDIMNFDGAKI